MHWCIDLLNFSEFLVLNGLLFLKFFQGLSLFFNSKLNLIQPIVEILVFCIKIFPQILVDVLFCSGIVKLNLDDFKLLFLLLLVFLLTFDLDLLFGFFLEQLIILRFELSLEFLIVTDSLLNLGQLCLVRFERNRKKLLFFFELFVCNGILTDWSHSALIDGFVLLHHGMESFHFRLEFLYFLFWDFFVFSGKLQILVGFWNLCLEIRNCVRVIIGKLKGRLKLCGTCNNIFGELAAFSEELFLLFMGMFKGPMDLFVLNSEAVEGLVGTQAHEDLLELRLQLLVCDGLDSELLNFVFHLFICNFIYLCYFNFLRTILFETLLISVYRFKHKEI